MSAQQEKFCLRWNDFETNISVAFRELREDKDFFDVTLACDDDQIQAHKVILSACSPFFRKVLKRNPHERPLLYLKGVRYAEIVAVLNFMYHGEVNVAQEDLNTFLAVAEDLQVKGLTQNDAEKIASSPKQSNPVEKPIPSPKRLKAIPAEKPKPVEIDESEIEEVVPIKTEPLQSHTSDRQLNQCTDFGSNSKGQMVAENDAYEADYVDYSYEEGYNDNSMMGQHMPIDQGKYTFIV